MFGPLVPGGHVAVLGFAVDADGAPVRKIDVTLDGSIRGEAVLRGLRPDVLSHFARQDYLWSGWKATASLRGVAAGTHSIDLVAVTHSGRTVPCGARVFEVLPADEPPRPRGLPIALKVLGRTGLFLLWMALVGLAPAAAIRGALGLPAAPVFGLALFGVAAEWGGTLHVRPSHVAVALTFLSLLALAWTIRSGRIRLPPLSRNLLLTGGFTALFALVGVIPLAAHGDGAVLGDIDDATRECVVADSISWYGWRVPPDTAGYLAAMRGEIWRHGVRPGGIYLLSALADTFGVRAHEVHSVAMLATGCLIVWGTGLLALSLSGRRPRRGWIAAALVAVNSVLLSGLYGQHFGNLIGTALFLPFLASTVDLLHKQSPGNVLAVALLLAAGLALYPESLLLWALSGALAIAVVRPAGRMRSAAARLALAFVLAAAMNPIGSLRFARFARNASRSLSSPLERTIAGDTHYFPEPTVIWGIEPYREDAPAPLAAPHRAVVWAEAAAIVGIVLVGWRRLAIREKAIVSVLVVPVGLALLANLRVSFPYGYSKFLLIATPLWATAFVLLASPSIDPRPGGAIGRARAAFAWITLTLGFLLAASSAAYVVRRATRSVPAYDPAYRALPALARTVGRNAAIVVDEPNIASREWMRYFLGENVVYDTASRPAQKAPAYLLVDRRRNSAALMAPPVPSSRAFALVSIEDAPKAAP